MLYVYLSLVYGELSLHRDFLQKLREDGKLAEHLEKEPNFLHSVLSDPRLTEEEVYQLTSDLFGGGIDSVCNHNTFTFRLII